MRAQHLTLERLPFTTGPLTDAVTQTAMKVDHLLQPHGPIVKVFPQIGVYDADCKATTTYINLPMCATIFATSQFHVRTAIDRDEALLERRSIVAPDLDVFCEIAAPTHRES